MNLFNPKKSIARLVRKTKRRIRLTRDGLSGKSGRVIQELRQKLKVSNERQARELRKMKVIAAKNTAVIQDFKRRARELSNPSHPANSTNPSMELLERARNANAIRLTSGSAQETRDFRKLMDDTFSFFRGTRVGDYTPLLRSLVPVRHADFTRNALEQTEILLRLKDKTPARSYAYSLMDTPGMESIGRSCMVKIALSEQRIPFAHSLYQQLGDHHVLEYLPMEWIVILAVTEPAEFLKRTTAFFSGEPPDKGFEFHFALAKQVFTRGDSVLALRILAWLEIRAIPEAFHTAFVHFRDSLSRVIHAEITADANPEGPDSGTLRIGVLDYKNPDFGKISRNVGDYIQTLAFLGNVIEAGARNQCRWAASATQMIGIAMPESPSTEKSTGPVVEFERLDRDFMSASRHLPKTWVIVYGWYMHPQFDHTYDFPFPPNLRPVFLSFHINRPEILTPSAIDYLKAHGPIGCRDWSTVYLLRDHQVEAFFSGCMTMTLNKIYQNRPRGEVPGNLVAWVDVPPKQAALIDTAGQAVETITQELDVVRQADFAGNLYQAKKLLNRYRDRISAVYTSRLHCYLPCRAIGVPVEFVTKPGKENDIRFEGLIGIDQDAFEATRDALQTKLAGLLDALIAGGTDAEIYRTWSELCREDLEKAERYCSPGGEDAPRFEGIPERVAAILAGKQVIAVAGESPAEWVEVSLALDRNQLAILPNVLRSITAHARSTIRFHLLTRDLSAADLATAGTCVAGHELIMYPMDEVFYGENLTTLPHITVSTMDRLLLPHILEDVDKVLYLDTDILVRADLTELFRLDLGDQPLAGRSSLSETWKNGYQLVYRAARALPAEAAFAYRRLMHDLHGGLGFPCFNAGILLLNLDRMRRDDFCRRFLPWADRFRLNDQDILNCYCGFGRKELPARWNSFPTQEIMDDPRLVHWAGPLKPWSSTHTIFSDEWRSYSIDPTHAGAAVGGRSDGLIPLHLGKRHFLLNPATMKLEAAQQQLSTFTRPARHLQLLRNLKENVIRLGLPADFSILSYGCSEGFECLDIRSVFPEARIFGCDINETALECARERCPEDVTLFFSNDANLRLHGPYDVVVAFNVFCYYPETAGLDEIAGLYPIRTMEDGLLKLEAQLRPEGILGIYNSPYFIESTSLAPRLRALTNKEETDNGWIEKCDTSGRRLTDVRFTFEGKSYNRAEWTEALRTPALKDRVIFTDYEAVECRQHARDGASLPGSVHTTFWSKGPPQTSADVRTEFTQNWTPHLETALDTLFPELVTTRFTAVEIGCFEGKGSLLMASKLCAYPESRLYCIDPWDDVYIKTDERLSTPKINGMCLGQYGRFISNTKSEARIIPLKGTSDERIPELPDDLDFAYIDGDHTPEQVYKDAIHIFRKMKPGGIVLFDDYQFSVNGVITAEGIDRFLEEHACDLEILFKGVQVAVRKTAR